MIRPSPTERGTDRPPDFQVFALMATPPAFITIDIPARLSVRAALRLARAVVPARLERCVCAPYADDIWGHCIILDGVLADQARIEPELVKKIEEHIASHAHRKRGFRRRR